MEFYQAITDFIFVEDAPKKADVIFVPGGNYPDAAIHAAWLYRQEFAPWVLPSGRYSIMTGRFLLQENKSGACGAEAKQECSSRARSDKKKWECSSTEGDWQEQRYRCSVRGSVAESVKSAEDGAGTEFETEFEYLRAVLRSEGVPDAAILREDRATYTYQNAIFSRERLEELNIPVHRALLCCQAFHARRCLLYYQEQFPDTEILVCPVVTRGISRDTWTRTETGIDTVLGEVERCGSQFHAIMREHMGAG